MNINGPTWLDYYVKLLLQMAAPPQIDVLLQDVYQHVTTIKL